MDVNKLNVKSNSAVKKNIKFRITLMAIKPIYSMIKKDGLNFVRLYFLNYTWYLNDLHNI
jgi:hypothetical protein